MPKLVKQINNNHGDDFYIVSGDDYISNNTDEKDLQRLLSEPAVYKYITKETLKKYYGGNEAVDLLSRNFLESTGEKWNQDKEYRFFIRNHEGNIVGIIGLDNRLGGAGELWYYKSSTSPGFMSTALPAVIDFVKLLGFRSIFALIEPDNSISNHLLTNLNFEPKGKVLEEGKNLLKFELILN